MQNVVDTHDLAITRGDIVGKTIESIKSYEDPNGLTVFTLNFKDGPSLTISQWAKGLNLVMA